MIELQGETDEGTVIVRGFNTLCSVTAKRSPTENYIYHTENLINTINQSDLRDIEYSARQQTRAHILFPVCI